jgi:hypothetical protein
MKSISGPISGPSDKVFKNSQSGKKPNTIIGTEAAFNILPIVVNLSFLVTIQPP